MTTPRPLAPAALAAAILPVAGWAQPPEPLPAHPREIAAPRPRIELPTADGRRWRLPRGAVAYVAEDHSLPLVEVTVALRLGSFLDPPGQVGLASLTGALLERGGAGPLTADQFDARAEELGARLGSSSHLTRAGASLSVPRWSLAEGLDLFFAMLAEPRFQADRVATAVGRLRESMGRRNQDPLAILEREWEWLVLGPDHFSTLPVTAATVAAIGRDDLVRFHRRHWRPEGMVFAVSGDLDAATAIAELAGRLAAWPEAPGDARPASWPPAAPAHRPVPGLYHVPFDAPQAKVALGHRAPRLPDWTARERFALALATEILGGSGAISRLAGRLRTAEGLVYRATAGYPAGTHWPGVLRVFFDTRSASTPRALAAALQEIARLRVRPVRPRELEVARTTLLSRLRMSFDTAEEIVGYLAEDDLLGRPHGYWQTRLETLATITAAEVQAAARDYLLPDRLVVLVVGRWPDVAGAERDGRTELERIAGHRVTHLPVRDPMTLRPRP